MYIYSYTHTNTHKNTRIYIIKVETVSGEYLIASGVPVQQHHHVEVLMFLALRIKSALATLYWTGGAPLCVCMVCGIIRVCVCVYVCR